MWELDSGAPSNLYQDSLNAVVPVPVSENWQLRLVNLAIYLAHERKVDAGHKLDSGGLIGVILATGDSQTVNAVLMNGL